MSPPRRGAPRTALWGAGQQSRETMPARLHSSSARTKAHPVQGFWVGGWAAGGSLSSRKQTLKCYVLRLLSFPQGRYMRCFIRPDVQVSVSAHPGRNIGTQPVVCLSSQHTWRWRAAVKCSGRRTADDALLRSHARPRQPGDGRGGAAPAPCAPTAPVF